MGTIAKKILKVMALAAVFLTFSQAMGHAQSRTGQAADPGEELSGAVPNLSDITPLSAQLSGRLEALEIKIVHLSPDVSQFEHKLAAIDAKLRRPFDQLSQMKDSKGFGLKKIVAVRKAVLSESQLFDDISNPLKNNIRQLGILRKEWLSEKKQWNDWRSAMIREGTFDQLKTAFSKADENIEAATHLILSHLEAMLALQEKAAPIRTKIYLLEEELNGLIATRRRTALRDRLDSVLSPRYFHQFSSELWNETKKGIDEIEWPDSRFFARLGWIILLQGFLSIFISITIWQNYKTIKDQKFRQFVTERPLSVALFAGCISTLGLYEVAGTLDVWRLALLVVSLISLCRLVRVLSQSSEKNEFVYALAIAIIATQLFEAINLPIPLFRLYLIATSFVGMVFCIRWARECARKEARRYSRLFRWFCLFLALITVVELSGRTKLAFYLFISLIATISVLICYAVFRYLIRGALEWMLSAALSHQPEGLHRDARTIIRQTAVVVDILLWSFLFIPTILLIWKTYETFGGAIKGFLSFGIALGAQRLSIGLLMTAAAILYATFVASWILQKAVVDNVLAKRHAEMGVRHAIEKLLHYVIVIVGFLLALSVLGLEITKLTIILSALGVGIGFGLQGVVNNFVSGIILLFERPVRVEDIVEIGSQWAVIKRIGLRSTIVATFGGSDLVIPNANFVNNEVTNWTLSSRRARIQIPVGVAYGSDVALVMQALKTCGKENQWADKTQDPEVLFLCFGESSLVFELRVWVYDVQQRLAAQSEIHREIDRRFREADIEIAFPQRDLRLRSIDDAVKLRLTEDEETKFPH